MKAKFVNEDIKDILKPKSIEDIVKDLDLKIIDINQILIAGIKQNMPYVINYALKEGANQLWWLITGPQGGYTGLSIPYITDNIVKIIEIKGSEIGKYKGFGFYDKTHFKVVFKEMWVPYGKPGHISTSKMFYHKYEPINIEKMDETIKNLQSIKRLNKKLNPL